MGFIMGAAAGFCADAETGISSAAAIALAIKVVLALQKDVCFMVFSFNDLQVNATLALTARNLIPIPASEAMTNDFAPDFLHIALDEPRHQAGKGLVERNLDGFLDFGAQLR